MNISLEDFITFYQVGVLIVFFICVYEYFFEMDKVNKIKDKFSDLHISNSAINVMLGLSWIFACATSWFYVGRKINTWTNKIDRTENL